MSKPWNPNRPTVDLGTSSIGRVSIRRDPPPPPKKQAALPDDSENETWAVAIGVLAFALAITILIFWVSQYTSPAMQPAPIVITEAS